jgi:S1-C subfamily serine protease
LIDPEKNRIRRLGVVGIAIDKDTEKFFPGLRGAYGVIVAALAASSSASMTGLQVGDVIHEMNGAAVSDVAHLTADLDKMKRGDPVALFIERDSKLQYLAFELQ